MLTSMDVSTRRRQMVEEMFARVDRKDPDALTPYLAEDATVIFGNAPALVGPDAAREGNRQFFASIEALHHEILGLWEVDGTVVVRLEVTYTRLDGGVVRVPVVTMFEEREGKTIHQQVYFDLAPVFGTTKGALGRAMA